MNRRGIIRGAVRLGAAFIFTTSGWLVGKGAIGMGGPCGDPALCDTLGTQYNYCDCSDRPTPCDPPNTYVGIRRYCTPLYCSNNGAYCGQFCYEGASCVCAC